MRVLVELDRALGDTVAELPILHALHASVEGLRLEVIVEARIADLIEDYTYIERIHRRDSGLRSRSTAVLSSWREPFDILLYLRDCPEIKLTRLLVRAVRKLGAECFDPGLLSAGAVPHRYSIVAALGIGAPREPITMLTLAPGRVRQALELAGIESGARILCVGPGASEASRMWPPEAFVRLLGSLQPHFDTTALLGSVAEQPVCARIAAASGATNLAGKPRLTQVAALLSQASLYLGNDSGLTHLAAAQGCPAVSIGLRSEYWFPWRGFAVRGRPSEIEPEDVLRFLRAAGLVP